MSAMLGVFVVATVVSALAPDYVTLLAARVATALSQALFWSIVVPTAAALFPDRLRGRAIAVVMSGNSLAAVLGVPAGTWLGQHTGWRTAFLALSGIGLLALAGVTQLLPGGPAPQGAEARGDVPDARRYALMLVTTVLAVTGAFAAFTYITPYLVDVALFSAAAIGPLLFVRGLAGVAGVTAGGWLADRSPFASLAGPVAVQAVALLVLCIPQTPHALVAVLLGASGLAFSAFTTALGGRVLYVAPRTKDLAIAGTSTAVNLGITAGALIGGVLLPMFGVRSAVLVGGLLSLAALGTALFEPLLRTQGHCVLELLLVTAVIRSWGRRLARRVARAMLVSPLARWNPIVVLRRVAMTAGPLPVRA
jgi:predicted MFS family arabinose efflux permease